MAIRLKYILILIALWICASGFESIAPKKSVWAPETSAGQTWTPKNSAYSQQQLNTPDEGYYRSPYDFTVPDSWPESAKRRFVYLAEDPHRYDKETVWASSLLKANEKFIESKSISNDGYLTLEVSSFRYFTFFTITPNTATVDQDFKGHVKISNLQDDQKYRIDCFDGMGYLGNNITALANKYIRDYFSGANIWSNLLTRSGQKIAEDRGENIWMIGHAPEYSTTEGRWLYERLFALDNDGKERWENIPTVVNAEVAADSWKSAIHINDDDTIVFGVGSFSAAPPFDKPSSYIGKINLSGSTVWELGEGSNTASCGGFTDPDVGYVPPCKVRPVEGIAKRDDGGYVYVGNFWRDYNNNANEGYSRGSIGRINDSGATEIWSSGVSYITDSTKQWHSIIKDTDGNYVVAGMSIQTTPEWSSDKTEGGTATAIATCDGAPANAFDGNGGTHWNAGLCYQGTYTGAWIKYDFGSGIAYAISKGNDSGIIGGWVYSVYGSNDDSTWTQLLSDGNLFATDWGNRTPYRYIKIYLWEDSYPCQAKLHENIWQWFKEWLLPSAYAATWCADQAWPGFPPDCCDTSGTNFHIVTFSIIDIELYEALTPGQGASLDKYDDSGNSIFNVYFPNGTVFNDVAQGRDGTYTAVGYNSNGIYVVNTNTSGVSNWEYTYGGVTGESIDYCLENGGYIISGTTKDGSTEKAFLLKIGDDGTEEFSESFTEPGYEAEGKDARETRDKGYIMTGAVNTSSTTSKIYVVKTNKYGKACSQGTPCD